MEPSVVGSASARARRSSLLARCQVRSKAAIWRWTRMRSLAAGDLGEEYGGEGVAGRFGKDGVVEVGLDNLEAALVPIGADHGVDVEGFGGGLGVVLVHVFSDKGVVIGGVFAGDDDGFGVDAVLQGVEAGGGLALGGAGSGGLLRVGAIGGDLCGGCHDSDLAHEYWGVWSGSG